MILSLEFDIIYFIIWAIFFTYLHIPVQPLFGYEIYVDVIRKFNSAGHIYGFMMHTRVKSQVIMALDIETAHGLGKSGVYLKQGGP